MRAALAAIVATFVLSIVTPAFSQDARAPSLKVFPAKLDKSCRTGRAKLYDECGDQAALFNEAMKFAAAHDKVLLVSYGADWCIWCHVFYAHISGKTKTFTYTYGSPDDPDGRETSTMKEKAKRDPTADAMALRGYVAENLVVVHIDAQYAPGSSDVLEATGALEHYDNWLPYLFTVGRDGKYAGKITHDDVMVRRDGVIDWYRGYDRGKLLSELTRIRDAAVSQAGQPSNE